MKKILVFSLAMLMTAVAWGTTSITLPKTHTAHTDILAADVNANEQHIESQVNTHNAATTGEHGADGTILDSTSPTITSPIINTSLIMGATNPLYLDAGVNTYIYEVSADSISFITGGTQRLNLSSVGLTIPATQKIYLDAGGNTYISENAADNVTVVCGGTSALGIKATGIGVPATAPIYFDGSGMTGDTYIHEASANNLYLVASGVSCLYMNGTNLFSPIVYSATTASAADVNVAATGLLARSTSARKYKTNERQLLFDKTKLMGLKAIIYNSKCPNDDPKKDFIGIVADDAMKYYPELVTLNDKGEPENFQYTRLTAVLLKAIQEQQVKIDSLEKRIEKLEAK